MKILIIELEKVKVYVTQLGFLEYNCPKEMSGSQFAEFKRKYKGVISELVSQKFSIS